MPGLTPGLPTWPLAQDLDPASFLPGAHPRPWWERALGLAPRQQQLVGLMAQGLQRRLEGGGQVKQLRQPSGQLEQALGPSTLVFLSGGCRRSTGSRVPRAPPGAVTGGRRAAGCYPGLRPLPLPGASALGIQFL